MKRRVANRFRRVTAIAAAALAIPCALAVAQEKAADPPDSSVMPETALPGKSLRNDMPVEIAPVVPPGEDSGKPRSLLPVEEKQPDAPAPAPARAPVARSNVAAPVQVGELGALEGPLAGTLDDSNGGLGTNEWQGSNRATMVTMLQSVPAATPSATHRLLMRKLLLTVAPPPPGPAIGSFNKIRLGKLLDGGWLDDAASLGVRMQEPNNPELLRIQTDAFLYAGRDDDACSDITSRRLDSAEPFWVELRAYCYAVTNDTGPLDLTRAVIMEQGIADPAFVTLLDGWTNGKPVMPDTIRFPDSIHIAMLSRLKLPMTTEVATQIGLPGSLIAAASTPTPAEIRISAAEKALRAGMLPLPVFAQVLDLSGFAPQDLEGAPALARVEPLMKALARLRAATKAARAPEVRAELVHTALEIGEREGILRQVAELFAEPAADIMPLPDWTRWSDLMVRGLLLAGKPEAAQRWLDILDPNASGMAAEAQQLNLAFALTAPNPRRNADTRQVLANLAQAIVPAPEPVQMTADGDQAASAMGQTTRVDLTKNLAKPSPEVIARAVLDLGIFEAVAADLMPAEAKSAVEPFMNDDFAGRRPAPVLMQRIDKAALTDSRGEVALSVATALGQRGPGDLAPDTVVRLIRALQTASMRDAAHLLAQEALLLRPEAGAGRP